jgi:hypothetical protein
MDIRQVFFNGKWHEFQQFSEICYSICNFVIQLSVIITMVYHIWTHLIYGFQLSSHVKSKNTAFQGQYHPPPPPHPCSQAINNSSGYLIYVFH